MNWTRLISKLIPTRKTLWPTNCFHSNTSSLKVCLAQLRKRLCSAIFVPEVTIIFFSPSIFPSPLPPISDCLSLVSFHTLQILSSAVLQLAGIQQLSVSHLESILRRWGTEGNERRIGLFSLHTSAADPTLLKLIQLLISESVIPSVMTTEVQRDHVSKFHNSKRCHGGNVCMERNSY